MIVVVGGGRENDGKDRDRFSNGSTRRTTNKKSPLRFFTPACLVRESVNISRSADTSSQTARDQSFILHHSIEIKSCSSS